ncbi:unnamed protein product [Closterium sp. NIES-64]|nr:unnamed protein product [Closterium sp. NIES-65]CAI5951185.1 unnamed protein product [Closterium sp. NIES-64]CAI5956061.1 unnamed protein product [Closterium sp. NIES-64]CAI6003418.1 unnamed protein product [Closterium sp. NIES-65]
MACHLQRPFLFGAHESCRFSTRSPVNRSFKPAARSSSSRQPFVTIRSQGDAHCNSAANDYLPAERAIPLIRSTSATPAASGPQREQLGLYGDAKRVAGATQGSVNWARLRNQIGVTSVSAASVSSAHRRKEVRGFVEEDASQCGTGGDQSDAESKRAEFEAGWQSGSEGSMPLMAAPDAAPGAAKSCSPSDEFACTIAGCTHVHSNVGSMRRLGNLSETSFRAAPLAESRPVQSGTKGFNLGQFLSQLLPYVVVATAVSALTWPATFAWFSKQYYAPALGGIMLSIGVQLSVEDFKAAIEKPVPVLLGLLVQYAVKPLIAAAIATSFRLPPAFAAGFLLTASVSGAQLSSYASYLAKADVALCIVLTSLSTFASVALTPILTSLLIGSAVPVDLLAMAKSILQVVILPVSLGLILNTYARKFVDQIRPIMPLLAIVCTSLCIGSPLAINRSQIVCLSGLLLLPPVLAFHLASFAAGFWSAKLPGMAQSDDVARTLSLCGGMQSSTLAMLLASQFLGSTHTVPASVSVVLMSIIGLSLGSFWGSGRKLLDWNLSGPVVGAQAYTAPSEA